MPCAARRPIRRSSIISGGEKRRVALCRLLLQKPDILILDEPTNHLDAESVQWLEQHLKRYEGTVIAVTHDRYFLDNVAGWILELDRGQGIPWKGNYSRWLEQKKTRLQIEEKTESARQKALAHELEWVRQSPKARQAKSKARIASVRSRWSSQEQAKKDSRDRNLHPARPAAGAARHRGRQDQQEPIGDNLLYDERQLLASRPAASSASSAPTARARPRSSA